ncbi:MAG: hypothetical protein U5K76_13710 [Woeseiaceae bacterium]|nr:hypothetical protein [Woeseiaceae bacterium]
MSERRCASLSLTLERMDIETVVAANLGAGRKLLASSTSTLPDGHAPADGLDLVEWMQVADAGCAGRRASPRTATSKRPCSVKLGVDFISNHSISPTCGTSWKAR